MQSDELTRAAVMGILSTAQTPQALYQAVARDSLRKQAGFIVPCTDAAAPVPDKIDTRRVINENCMDLLFSMFRQAHHSEALPELLIHIILNNRRIPPEALPHLLAPGVWNVRLRQHFYAAIGHRSLWLAQQQSASTWTWIRRFAPEDPAQIPARDTWREKDFYDLIADEQWVQMERNLQYYYSTFTASFASTFIQALGATCRTLRYRDALYALLWKILAYRCPLSHYDELLDCLHVLPEHLKFTPETFQEILDFRIQMIKLVRDD
ncbi:MAG: DUF5691 domain-containing protein [Aggregatilineales bacterium]